MDQTGGSFTLENTSIEPHQARARGQRSGTRPSTGPDGPRRAFSERSGALADERLPDVTMSDADEKPPPRTVTGVPPSESALEGEM